MDAQPGIRYEIIVPKSFNKKDNEKIAKPISKKIINRYRDELVHIFKGMTQLNAVTGFWLDPIANPERSALVKDENYLLRLDGSRTLRLLYSTAVEQVLLRMRDELEQELIYCTIVDCERIFLWREEPRDGPPNSTYWRFLFDRHDRLIDRCRGVPTAPRTEMVEGGDRMCQIGHDLVEKYGLDKLDVQGRAPSGGS